MWLFFGGYTIQLITIKLSQVVAEKSLTEKKFTDKHTYRKGKNYIPPIYFV